MRLAQFHHELRIARQVSHKNVGRLYALDLILFEILNSRRGYEAKTLEALVPLHEKDG